MDNSLYLLGCDLISLSVASLLKLNKTCGLWLTQSISNMLLFARITTRVTYSGLNLHALYTKYIMLQVYCYIQQYITQPVTHCIFMEDIDTI